MKLRLILFSIPLTFALGSCSSEDIEAAQNLAKLQDTARVVFPQIANDIYQSCLRSADLNILNTPTEESGMIDRDRQKAKANCQDNELAASQAVNNVNKIIVEYLGVLGQIAADDLINYDSEIDSIGTSLQTLPQLSADEKKEAINAGASVAKFLFRAFTDGYRREQLKQAVTTVNSPLQILIAALDKSVGKGYINGLLADEQIDVDSYYKYQLGRVLTAPNTESVSLQVSTEIEQDNNWKNTNQTIQAKRVLAGEYLGLLKKIGRDHQTLNDMYTGGKEPSEDEIKQMLKGYSKQLESINQKSEDLFPQSTNTHKGAK